MPVAPGRSVAILVEVAARNQLLRSRGHHAARELAARLEQTLRDPPTGPVRPGGASRERRRTPGVAGRRGRRARARGSAVKPARKSKPASPVATATGMDGQPFIVLTGLSGSGKSQAIRALEDLGYFCVDNLPTTLIPTLAKLSLRAAATSRRSRSSSTCGKANFLSSFPKIFRQLRKMPRLNPVLIFLEARHAALVRRFSETRRPHPLAPGSIGRAKASATSGRG